MQSLLGAKADRHPLVDAGELKRTISALPKDNAFKALDEIAGWLESLQLATEVPLARLYEALWHLDEAAQPHLKRLTRDYLHSPRLSRADERRLWSINYGFWTLLSAGYERCLGTDGPVPEAVRPVLTALCTRLIAALGGILKWDRFRYGPTPDVLWKRLGRGLLVAEEAGLATRSVFLSTGQASPAQEYQKAVLFQAASMDSLLPVEIELAERLITHFFPAFVFTREAQHDSVYWVDLAQSEPPQRLAKIPAQSVPTQRFCKPGAAHAAFEHLLKQLSQGGDIPPEINLGGQYAARTLVPVLRHLALYFAPVPPQRRHDRHRVKHRMAVLNGLINAFVAVSGEFGGRPAGLQIESWVVDNVSRGGFGAVINEMPAEWLKVGALLALQPEGGENWVLGIVRRYHRQTEKEALVGIEALARQAVAVELKPRTISSYAALSPVPALIISEACSAGEVRVVLPPMTFDLRESFEYLQDGQRLLLTPLVLQEQSGDFELGRYRQSVIS